MPIRLREKYSDDRLIQIGEIADGKDKTLSVILAGGILQTLIVIARGGNEPYSKVIGVRRGSEELTAAELVHRSADNSNLRALMLPGEPHTVHLQASEGGPTALIIEDLTRQAMLDQAA